MNTPFQYHMMRSVNQAYANCSPIGRCHPKRILSEHDFVYILEGDWIIEQNGISYPLKPDDVILLTAGEHHGGSVPCADGTKTIYLHVNAFDSEILTNQEYNTNDDTIAIPVVIHCRKYPQVKDTFSKLVKTFSSDTPHRKKRLNTLFQLLLLYLYDAAQDRLEARQNAFVENILQTIHENPHTFFTNEALAERHFACSKTIVNRLVSHTGMTPYQYQLHYKLENIRGILAAEPTIRLHELAKSFGFYDEFHLSRIFKKHFGESTKEYRAKVRNTHM